MAQGRKVAEACHRGRWLRGGRGGRRGILRDGAGSRREKRKEKEERRIDGSCERRGTRTRQPTLVPGSDPTCALPRSTSALSSLLSSMSLRWGPAPRANGCSSSTLAFKKCFLASTRRTTPSRRKPRASARRIPPAAVLSRPCAIPIPHRPRRPPRPDQRSQLARSLLTASVLFRGSSRRGAHGVRPAVRNPFRPCCDPHLFSYFGRRISDRVGSHVPITPHHWYVLHRCPSAIHESPSPTAQTRSPFRPYIRTPHSVSCQRDSLRHRMCPACTH